MEVIIAVITVETAVIRLMEVQEAAEAPVSPAQVEVTLPAAAVAAAKDSLVEPLALAARLVLLTPVLFSA